MIPASQLFKLLLPLLTAILSLVLATATVVAPMISLTSSDLESRDVEGEEKETETERVKERRTSSERVTHELTWAVSKLRGGIHTRPLRPAHLGNDTWSMPRRL